MLVRPVGVVPEDVVLADVVGRDARATRREALVSRNGATIEVLAVAALRWQLRDVRAVVRDM